MSIFSYNDLSDLWNPLCMLHYAGNPLENNRMHIGAVHMQNLGAGFSYAALVLVPHFTLKSMGYTEIKNVRTLKTWHALGAVSGISLIHRVLADNFSLTFHHFCLFSDVVSRFMKTDAL